MVDKVNIIKDLALKAGFLEHDGGDDNYSVSSIIELASELDLLGGGDLDSVM